jgi:hypothetical protein
MPIATSRKNDYLLIMSGSIHSAPFLICWKFLKDHIRQNGAHPGYTHVISASDTGIYRGWCHFTSEDDAKTAYSTWHSELAI